MKPGVIWYRANPGRGEKEKPHGKFVNYLDESDENDRRFKACDKDLFDALRDVVARDRTIAALEDAQLLPGAVYWREDVRHGKKKSTCPRDDWFQDAFKKTAGCDLVFLDPDTGIQCANLLPTQGKSRKYVFRDEIGELIRRG